MSSRIGVENKRLNYFDIFNIILLTILALIIIIPFYYTIVISLMTQSDYSKSPGSLWPAHPTLDNYKAILLYGGFIRSFCNSLIVVVVGVTFNMFLTVTMAFAFSKKDFIGRNFLFNIVIFTMFFGGGLIPSYLLVSKLGLREHLLALIIPSGLSVFNMIIMKNFFQQLPKDIEEAASIDGAGPVRVLVQILLPLVTPAMATLVLFYSVDRWNDWFTAMLYISQKELYPIQMILRDILWNGSAVNIPSGLLRQNFGDGIKAASVIIVMIPVMVLYPYLQKYFVKGIMIGAIKS